MSPFPTREGQILTFHRSQSKPDIWAVARIAALDKEITASTQELEELREKSGNIEKAIQDLEARLSWRYR